MQQRGQSQFEGLQPRQPPLSGNRHAQHCHANCPFIEFARARHSTDFPDSLIMIVDHCLSVIVGNFNKASGRSYNVTAQLFP